MKVIINEHQYKLLLEATEGLDSFIETLKQKGLIDYKQHEVMKGYGNNPPPSLFKNMLGMFRQQLKSSGADNVDKAAEYIYNMVKV